MENILSTEKREELTKLVWQHMDIDANDEHILIEVAFWKSDTEGVTNDELISLVKDLIPVAEWDEEGIVRHKTDENEPFFVILWWSVGGKPFEPYLKERFQKLLSDEMDEDGEDESGKPEWYNYPDDGELHLDQEGQRKLAELVKNSVVCDDHLIDDEELTKEEWFTLKYLVLDKDLYRLFGETALKNVISQVFPGWTVDCPNNHDKSSVGITLYSKPLGNTLKEAAV